MFTAVMQISEELERILGYASEEALRTGRLEILPEHLLLAMLRREDNAACTLLSSQGVSLALLRKDADRIVFNKKGLPYSERENVRMTRECAELLRETVTLAVKSRKNQADSTDLLRAMTGQFGGPCRKLLLGLGLSVGKLNPEIKSGEAERIGSAAESYEEHGQLETVGSCGNAVHLEGAEPREGMESDRTEMANALFESLEGYRAFILSYDSKIVS